jgi:hypothetical protein
LRLLLTEMRGRVSQEAPITTSASLEHKFLARTMDFHRTIVKQFFCLSSLYNKYNFGSNNTYIVDETGISTVPTKKIKVLGLSGKRQLEAYLQQKGVY